MYTHTRTFTGALAATAGAPATDLTATQEARTEVNNEMYIILVFAEYPRAREDVFGARTSDIL